MASRTYAGKLSASNSKALVSQFTRIRVDDLCRTAHPSLPLSRSTCCTHNVLFHSSVQTSRCREVQLRCNSWHIKKLPNDGQAPEKYGQVRNCPSQMKMPAEGRLNSSNPILDPSLSLECLTGIPCLKKDGTRAIARTGRSHKRGICGRRSCLVAPESNQHVLMGCFAEDKQALEVSKAGNHEATADHRSQCRGLD